MENEQPKLPEGVTEADLYEGPTVVPMPKKPLFTAPAELVQPIPAPPQVSPVQDVKKGYPAILIVALDVLSARLLGLLAVIAACGMWSFAVWDPQLPRTIAATLFSVTVLLPLIVLYWKAGRTGEEEK